MRDTLYRENLHEDPPATPDEIAADTAHRAIPIRVSDLADELEGRAIQARKSAQSATAREAAILAARGSALFEAAALARGDKPFAHVQPEVVAHQPVVIEMHSPASIGRMSDEDRRAHGVHVLDVIQSMRVQLGRLGAPDPGDDLEVGRSIVSEALGGLPDFDGFADSLDARAHFVANLHRDKTDREDAAREAAGLRELAQQVRVLGRSGNYIEPMSRWERQMLELSDISPRMVGMVSMTLEVAVEAWRESYTSIGYRPPREEPEYPEDAMTDAERVAYICNRTPEPWRCFAWMIEHRGRLAAAHASRKKGG